MDALDQHLLSLDLNSLVPEGENAKALVHPLDICRASLAKLLVDVAECSEEDAHKSIQWPNNIFNGDLAVVLPKLRQGVKADKLAVEIMEKVLPSRKQADFEDYRLTSSVS